MCGRFVIDDSEDIKEMRTIFDELRKHYSDTLEFLNVRRGEVFPTNIVPILIPDIEAPIDAVPMQWGINAYNNNLIINACSETVYEKRMFRDSIQNKRCVIPCNGFYEWAKLRDVKEKYLIKPTDSPMLYLAGIYEKLHHPTLSGNDQIRFVILTRESRGLIRSLHHRMPVTIERRYILKWLNGEKSDVEDFFLDTTPPDYTFTNLGAVS
ncbi:MAG: SOS response-associated peptidase [Oscillospiraceae bacterium]|nr:SOS response-associated peptidase [Oscillospiraceae bacterium]